MSNKPLPPLVKYRQNRKTNKARLCYYRTCIRYLSNHHYMLFMVNTRSLDSLVIWFRNISNELDIFQNNTTHCPYSGVTPNSIELHQCPWSQPLNTRIRSDNSYVPFLYALYNIYKPLSLRLIDWMHLTNEGRANGIYWLFDAVHTY